MDILHNGAITLHHGDCLDVMHDIPDASVDAIITDPPYGVTSCAWDSVIPFEPMWVHLKRIIKPRGAIVLFGSQPFTSALVMSNVDWFRDEWIWKKDRATLFQHANRKPMKRHENILVFALGRTTYNPQFTQGKPYTDRRTTRGRMSGFLNGKIETVKLPVENQGTRYPTTDLFFSCEVSRTHIHPTQKPVALLEYLIRTYTNEGETVLDFTFGSCTTGVAALTTERRFIGIERDATYYALGVQRVRAAIDNLPPMDV